MPAKKTEPSSSTAPSSTLNDEVSILDHDAEQSKDEEDNTANGEDLFRAIFKNSDSETSDDSSKEESESETEIKQEADGKSYLSWNLYH